ncbi:porin [Paraburkholderia hospita]|uniref:porin n=1 Tax=Paraburkholderia hospita TaxID=169430 RepID=UPI0008A7E0F3|nr:porin [Paraburkholderia hospita]SEI15614.1 Outer membrane protein (porin) [Paraburkholderia hospita]
MLKRKSAAHVATALGVCVCSTHAEAQSNVTLYGIVDSGFFYSSKSIDSSGNSAGKKFALIDSGLSPSQFGLKGTEDLGGGLKLDFDLESGINMTNGGYNSSNGNFFGRQAWMQLRSDIGNVKMGLQFSPFFLTLYDLDPRGLAPFGTSVVHYIDNVVGTGLANANAISYTSPVIAGLQASVMYAFGGTPGDFQAGQQYSASVKYDNGSLLLAASIYNGNAGGTAASTPVPTTVEFAGRMIGGGYRFGKLTVKASYTSYKVAGAMSNNVWGGGADFLATPEIDVNAGVWYASDRNNTANHSLLGSAGINYYLSKDTTLYGQVAVVNNHGAMTTGLSVNGALKEGAGTSVGGAIGVRHMF